MLLLGDYAAAFAPAALVLGLALVALPFCRKDAPAVRAILFAVAILLSWRYMAWRFAETIPPLGFTIDAAVGWSFALLEAGTVASSSLAFLILSRTRDRCAEAGRHAAWWRPGPAPFVDVLVATYNEEEAILERTIVGALAVRHPNTRVWVLDDARRPWLRDMCSRLGARYLTRTDNAHAKAGNINAAFEVLRGLAEPPAFVAVLDADFVPHRDFLERALALFHDPAVGLVQTPQHFFNPDPIQHNLGIGRAYPDEQRFFFDHIQPSRDAWGLAFCCGTSSVMRWSALEAIGGFPVGSVTEDYLITLRLREEGYDTVYLNEPLTEGLAPEGLGEYITQRGRWCLGLMQIIRGPMGPFARNRLGLLDRVGLVDSLLYWATTYPFRLACLATPLLYWFFGITVVNAPVAGVVGHFLPYLLAVLVAANWTSGGLVVPVLNDVGQVLGAKEITKAVAIGLARPKGHKFKVTAKGGDRDRVVVQWPLLRPLLALFALTVAGLLFSPVTGVVFDRDAGDGTVVDRLRGFQRDEEDAAVDAAPLALALAATDPANPYGAALDWPSVPAGPDGVVPTGHRPGRKAGAVVVLIAGRLALYMERGGRTLLAFTEESGELRAAAEALVWALRTGRTERLSLEKVNGGPVLGTPLAEAMLAAGFYSSPSGIRFRN